MVRRLVQGGVCAEEYNLDLCDVAFVKDSKTYVHAEIKKHADLLASIGTDYRYHEQSASMGESCVPYCFYLLEGFRHPPNTTADDQRRIEHAMTRVQLSGPLGQVDGPASSKRCHIAAIPLGSPDGVVSWICYVYRNLVEDPSVSDGVFAPLCENVRHTFGSKPAKRDQSRVYIEQLTRLSGISDNKAKSIADVFPSMSRLTEFLASADKPSTIADRLQSGLGMKAAEMLYTQMLAPDERRFDWPVRAKRYKSE